MIGRRMLVVEDDPVARRLLGDVFRRHGWLVTTVATVAEALGLLDPPPDGIVLDLMLPDGDGEAILSRVRRENPATRIAIITGCLDLGRLSAAVDFDPVALLCKPIDVTEVFHAFS